VRTEAISAGANRNVLERPTLCIHVDNGIGLSARDQKTAEQELIRIHAAAGVHAIWAELAPIEDTRAYQCARVTVISLDSRRTERMTKGERQDFKILGRAAKEARQASLFYPRIATLRVQIRGGLGSAGSPTSSANIHRRKCRRV
jgi:hypothetical protein